MEHHRSLCYTGRDLRRTGFLAILKQALFFPNLLLISAILLGFAARFMVLSLKKILEFDDAVTILAATGHEGEYAQISSQGAYPIGAWVPASEWKRLIEIEAGRGFGQIATDLSRYDIHPPLYFWLVHVWISAFGNSLWPTHLFNIVVDLLIALVIIGIGRQIFRRPADALLVSAVWLLSPVAIKTTYWVRQYSFFTLIVLLYAFLLFKSFYINPRIRWLSWSNLWLAVTILAGMLTHYYFAIFLLVGIVLVGSRWVSFRKDRLLPVALALVLCVSGLLFLFFFPGFYYSILGYYGSKFVLTTTIAELNYRIRIAVKMIPLLFSPVLVGIALWLDNSLRKERSTGWRAVPNHEPKQDLALLVQRPSFRWAVAFAVLPLLAIAGMYLAGVSQAHTFSSRYLGYVTPFVAFIPVFLLLHFEDRARWASLLAGAMIGLGFLTLTPGLTISQQGSIDRMSLQTADPVVIDSIDWGTWPGVVQYLDPDQEVYIDSQEGLVDRPELWLDRLGDRSGIYVSILRGQDNTPEGRGRILQLISGRYKVEQLSAVIKPEDWEVRLYRLTPGQARLPKPVP